MNRFPIWKYLLIALVLITATIYTLPNFFGETPAVQISSTRQSTPVDTALMARIETTLKQQGIAPQGIFLDGNSLKVNRGRSYVAIVSLDEYDNFIIEGADGSATNDSVSVDPNAAQQEANAENAAE